jgi:predicted pyridoxine 5'-phosphate oxidase superfamily flavin-nucleotide-binding protein
MCSAFAKLTFTDSVKAAQTRYGSRDKMAGHEGYGEYGSQLGEAEADFLAERDSFYIATVGETGWPYVQHRGGPAGFVRVLGTTTIGYADFRGNLQYLSMGNLDANDKVALIMVDYARKRRLKLLGRARIVHQQDDPALMERLALPGYNAKVERGIVIEVEAIEWNCPQHITPRFTLAEVEKLAARLQAENAALKAELASLRGS